MAEYFDVKINYIIIVNDGCADEITRQGKYNKQLSRDCCFKHSKESGNQISKLMAFVIEGKCEVVTVVHTYCVLIIYLILILQIASIYLFVH